MRQKKYTFCVHHDVINETTLNVHEDVLNPYIDELVEITAAIKIKNETVLRNKRT